MAPAVPFRAFAIIPAAGRSQRMGQPKLLLPLAGRTIIEHVVAAWRDSRVQEIVVVVSGENEPVARLCRTLPCHVVVPPTPPADMKASVGYGLRFIEDRFSPEPQDAWLVAPADLPTLSAAVINAVIEAYDPSHPAIVVPKHGSRRGHPVLFPWALAGDALALPDGMSLKDLMERPEVIEVPLPKEQRPDDVDTPQDYRNLLQRHKP